MRTSQQPSTDITTIQRQATVMLPPYTSSRYGMLETTRNSWNTVRRYDHLYYTYYAYNTYGELVPHTGIRTIYF